MIVWPSTIRIKRKNWKNIYRNHGNVGNHAGNCQFLTILAFLEFFGGPCTNESTYIWSCSTPTWLHDQALFELKEKLEITFTVTMVTMQEIVNFWWFWPFWRDFGSHAPMKAHISSCNTSKWMSGQALLGSYVWKLFKLLYNGK